MTEQELKQIFSLGESSFVEFKREDAHTDSLAKVIVAYSNFEGGDIWIGVEDDGTVSGISQPKLEEKIVQICRQNVSPPLIPAINIHTVDGKKVMQVRIEKGKSKPYKTQGKFFIRAGSLSIEPTNEELMRLFQEGELLHFETKSVYGSSIQDLDRIKLDVYLREYRKIAFQEDELPQLLQNLRFVDEEYRLTVVGMLFFGKNPTRRLPQAGIDLALFDGEDKTADVLDRKTAIDDVPSNINAALNFVKYNSRLQYYFPKGAAQRLEMPDYDPFVVRELIANASQHRDWTIFGQQITVYMFSNRMEIFSPGKLPNTMSLKSALSGVSYSRNPIHTQLLRDFDFIEKTGRGLNRIMKYYSSNSLKEPEFEADPHYFKVTLFKANPLNIVE